MCQLVEHPLDGDDLNNDERCGAFLTLTRTLLVFDIACLHELSLMNAGERGWHSDFRIRVPTFCWKACEATSGGLQAILLPGIVDGAPSSGESLSG